MVLKTVYARRRQQSILLQDLQARGFDRSTRGSAYSVQLGCSQCAALAINGIGCHETGCPNIVHECKGCNERVNRDGAYCVDCQ